jgi:hypothetical protein
MDMTDLQMGLIGLGGAAVIGVLAYNKWQEHKHRKLAEELLSARQADVLLDEVLPDEVLVRTGRAAPVAVGDVPASPAVAPAGRPRQERVEPLLRQENVPDDAGQEVATSGGAARPATPPASSAGGAAGARPEELRSPVREAPRRFTCCRRRSITLPRSRFPSRPPPTGFLKRSALPWRGLEKP